jgi:hypothetical protein
MHSLPDGAEFWAFIVTFIVGWGSGFMTAWAMFRDHDRRIGNSETLLAEMSKNIGKNTQDIAVLYTKLRVEA